MDHVGNPWPGPRPYNEAEWRLFSGRGAELLWIKNALSAQRLSLVVGGTGSGKTSLVLAGVTPLLRFERYHQRSDHSQWPVLVLRRWGAGSGDSATEILLRQIEEAIQALERWGRLEGHERAVEDADLLRKILEKGKIDRSGSEAAPYILASMAGELAKKNRREKGSSQEAGIILIFDQFEELLRGDRSTASEALRLIRDLYLSERLFRILIVLRQEYVYALKELEQLTGGLVARSMVLRPMHDRAILEVLADVSSRADLAIDSDVAKSIVGWARNRAKGSAFGPVEEKEDHEVNLLQLQAILRELSHLAIDRRLVRVSLEVLKEFEGLCGEDSLGGALERWIESVLQQSINLEGEESRIVELETSVNANGGIDMSEQELQHQMRRVAIRIGPHMASLDYKVPQEENTLLRLALGNEIARLGIKDLRLLGLMRIIDGEAVRINWEELGLSPELTEVDAWRLSGIAKRNKWSPVRTANQLVRCFRETLRQLARANIITPTIRVQDGGQIRVWELVHDQLGPSFANWASKHRDSWEDCLGALVVSEGKPIQMTFPEVRPTEMMERLTLTNLSWPGCTIGPIGRAHQSFHKAWFVDCFLNGVIFDGCHFYGGGFDRCSLHGALFRNCAFFDDDHGQAPSFEECDCRNLAVLNSSIEFLEFRRCKLRQPTIEDTVVRGCIRFTRESRVSQGYFDVSPREATKIVLEFDGSSRAFQCSTSPAAFGLLLFPSEESLGYNQPLPDAFWGRK